jgi:peptidyl-prolyl isomerase G (cyclophilin G)
MSVAKEDDPEIETEEQYDARLEREENERLAARKLRELEELRTRNADSPASDGGVRFKGQ